MEVEKMKKPLRNLIRDLQMAEIIYRDISSDIDNPLLRQWLVKNAEEKHNFHRELTLSLSKTGIEADRTEQHPRRSETLFHELNLNNFTDHYQPLINEIILAAKKLKQQYSQAMSEQSFTPGVLDILAAQKEATERDVKILEEIRSKLMTIPAENNS